MTIDGVSYPIEPPFLVMATQNPIESEGTYNLPEAQLDRFLFKLVVEYPSAAEETDILRLHTRGFGLDRGVADQLERGDEPGRGARDAEAGRERLVDDHVLAYIATLVRKTRQWPTFSLGASPRAGVAILRGARAVAALEGRDVYPARRRSRRASCRPCGIASCSRPRPRSRANPPTTCSPS